MQDIKDIQDINLIPDGIILEVFWLFKAEHLGQIVRYVKFIYRFHV